MTGVQTCALPIYGARLESNPSTGTESKEFDILGAGVMEQLEDLIQRSEERRVGKECRSRWSPYH